MRFEEKQELLRLIRIKLGPRFLGLKEQKGLMEIEKDLQVLEIFRDLIDSTEKTYFLKCPKKIIAGKKITEWLEGN